MGNNCVRYEENPSRNEEGVGFFVKFCLWRPLVAKVEDVHKNKGHFWNQHTWFTIYVQLRNLIFKDWDIKKILPISAPPGGAHWTKIQIPGTRGPLYFYGEQLCEIWSKSKEKWRRSRLFGDFNQCGRWRHQVAGGATWHCQLIVLALGYSPVKYEQNPPSGSGDIEDNVTDFGAPWWQHSDKNPKSGD